MAGPPLPPNDRTMTAPVALSIVIPAYNEERRLPRTLERVHEYVRCIHPACEVIVVDDGSSDGTGEVVSKMSAEMPELRLVSNGQNRGKGYSVRHGMLEARGRVALFTDADLSAPIEEAAKLLEALEAADVAIGSRAMDRTLIAVHQSRIRELAGILFNWMVRLFTGVRFKDTQCGFKAFAMPEARIVFEQQRIEDFGFDPEILFLAERHGLRATEVPVRWAHDAATKVHAVRDSARMFADLLRIRWNAATGRYPRRAK
ncbi:MAG TPA: dolichyl-phosphate beta-glucosyltransferase [Candidatus Acidoferrales bacterium]|nr:dolichyl-phosphate beta-glucosyltransferase [Candidatus Acidoferrales bacterium]